MKNRPRLFIDPSRNRGAFEIALLYLLIGSLWILFSDQLAARIAPNQTALTQISLYKGWGYIGVTALMLYWLINRTSTERKLAEEMLQNAHDELELQVQLRTTALSQANTLLETMLEYMPDQIYFKDTESRFIRNSKAQALALGLNDPAQTIGKTDFDFFPHAQRSYDEEQEMMRSGKPLVDFEEWVVWPNGQETWVSTTKAPLRDQAGQIIGTFGISRDITERKRNEESLRKAKEELELKVAERTVELSITNAQLQLELTERKQAEEKLRESEERFRRFFENMHETFIVQEVVVDDLGKPIDLRYLDVNPAAEHFIGKTRSEIVGKTRQQLVGRPDPEGVEMASHVASSGEPFHMIRYSPGFGGWFESFTYSLGAGIVATLSLDITERKQAEEALRESEALFRQAIEAAGAVPYSHNYEMDTYTFMGEGILALTGYPVEEMTPALFGSLEKQTQMMGEASHLPAKEAGKLMRAGQLKKWRCDSLVLARDGTPRWVADASVATFDGAGKAIGSVGILQDITERKRAEEALRKSEERLNGIIVSAMDAIISVDTEQIVMLFNAAAEKMFGCLASEAVGQPLERFIPERFRAMHREHIRIFGETGVTNRAMNALGVIFGLRTNGEEFPVEASISQIELDGKKLYTVILRDVTERKRAEDELKRSNAELEQFAYVASHDLQEPLRAVAGMVQLLQQRYQGKLDERADEYIGHAVDAAMRMQKLINDLLDYSRINRLGKSFEHMEGEKSLSAALANLQTAIQESQAEITHDPLPGLMADGGQLTQVLQNLIGNAIKFRGERPLHIHIGAKKIEHAWHFEIRDNGIGIEPEYFERIFLVFQRLHTRREYPGTGIGLSLCKKIIERHGGQIWLESQPGQGSTFYFTIPEKQL